MESGTGDGLPPSLFYQNVQNRIVAIQRQARLFQLAQWAAATQTRTLLNMNELSSDPFQIFLCSGLQQRRQTTPWLGVVLTRSVGGQGESCILLLYDLFLALV